MSNSNTAEGSAPSRRRYVLGLPFWLWLLLAAIVGIGLLQTQLGDQGMANALSGGVAMGTGLLCLAWFTLFSSYRWQVRWLSTIALLLLLAGVGAAFQIVGVSGNIVPTVAPRAWLRTLLGLSNPHVPLPIPETESTTRIDLLTASPGDFPQFLGRLRDNNVAEVKLQRDWTAHPPQEVWRQPIGAGWSGFAVVNGYAVTMEQRDQTELVTCYQVESGKLQWAYGIKARYDQVFGGVGPRCTPTIHQGRVYALGATGKFHCLDGSSGKLVWGKDLLKEFGITAQDEFELVRHGRSNSPLIVDDMVIVPAGGPSKGPQFSLAAFHQDSGALIWKGGDHNVSYASPALATLGGVRQILSVNEHQVSGHDPKTGKELWQFDWPGTTSNDANVSQPVPVPPDRVFVSKGYGGGAKMVQLIPRDDGAFEAKLIYHQNRNMRTKYTNVSIKDGYVYGLDDGVLQCMKLDTGEKVWRDGRYLHGQILRVDDLLLVLSEEGVLSLVEATPDKERANNVLGSIQALQGRTWNNLALSGPYLLVRNGQEAVCYRLPIAE